MTSMDMHACCCRKRPHNLPAAKCAISIIAQGLDGDICAEQPPLLLFVFPSSSSSLPGERRQPPDFWKRRLWLIIVIYPSPSAQDDTTRATKRSSVAPLSEKGEKGESSRCSHQGGIIYLLTCLFICG